MSLEPVQSIFRAILVKLTAKAVEGYSYCTIAEMTHSFRKQQCWESYRPYRPRVKLWFFQDRALNFAGFARVHMLWNSWLPELRICHVIDEFHSLQRRQFPFDETFLNSFRGQAEETLMLQTLCHLAVNVLGARQAEETLMSQALCHLAVNVKNECDPAWALLGEQLEAEDAQLRLAAVVGLGYAYAGSCREECERVPFQLP
eukprot:s1150_g11.t1